MKQTHRELMEKLVQLKTSLVLSYEDRKRIATIEKILNERLSTHRKRYDIVNEDKKYCEPFLN